MKPTIFRAPASRSQRTLGAIALVAFAAGVLTSPWIRPETATAASERRHADEKQSALLKESSESFRIIAREAEPSVVVVRTYRDTSTASPGGMPGPREPFRDFFEQFGLPPDGITPPARPEMGQGSAFVIDPRGYLLTNNHVIDGAGRIEIFLSSDESRPVTATLVGRDPRSDLAVLKIETASPLKALAFADSEKSEVGDWVVAVGSPFMLSHSVTAGIISAKGRNARHVLGSDFAYEMIQTDAAINPGNSGGPLLDLDGAVVGVNTAILSQTGSFSGIGFAIPSNLARQVSDELVKNGRFSRGWMGVSVQKASQELLKDLGLENGVAVAQVIGESPAARAGLRAGDIIVEIDGAPMRDPGSLQRLVGAHKPGEELSVRVVSYQDRASRGVRVTLADPEPDAKPHAQARQGASREKWGLRLRPSSGGVRVEAVQPGSRAEGAGLMAGDVIMSANRKPIRRMEDLDGVLSAKAPLQMRVRRSGEEVFLEVPPPAG